MTAFRGSSFTIKPTHEPPRWLRRLDAETTLLETEKTEPGRLCHLPAPPRFMVPIRDARIILPLHGIISSPDRWLPLPVHGRFTHYTRQPRALRLGRRRRTNTIHRLAAPRLSRRIPGVSTHQSQYRTLAHPWIPRHAPRRRGRNPVPPSKICPSWVLENHPDSRSWQDAVRNLHPRTRRRLVPRRSPRHTTRHSPRYGFTRTRRRR